MATLRPYQVESIDKLRDGFRQGHTRQILCAATGGGKSVIMTAMIEAAVAKRSKVMFICERRILVEQFSRHLDEIGVDHGILMAGHWRFRPQDLVQIATAQTLERMDSWPAFDVVFIDEIHCFPAGTMVDGKPIEDIKVGDTVNSFNHETGTIERRSVVATSVGRSQELLKITTDHGEIICTKDHKFWTGVSYIKACDLTNCDMLYTSQLDYGDNDGSRMDVESNSDVRILRGGISPNINQGAGIQKNKTPILHGGEMHAIAGKRGIGAIKSNDARLSKVRWVGSHEEQQSNEKYGSTREGAKEQGGDWIHSIFEGAWWKWKGYAKAATEIAGNAWRWVGCRVCNINRNAEKQRVSGRLQNRYSNGGSENCRGSGRGFSQIGRSERKGFEENQTLEVSRVVRVEILEQTSGNGSGTGGIRDTQVYDIEVEGNHNYFAGGYLVHNCAMRKSMITMFDGRPKLKVVGATATPFHKAIPKYFSNVVNVITMQQLTDDKFLVPFRVFIAHEIDTKGVKVVAGEWQKDELETRGRQIVGDIVADYIRLSDEVFGGPRKTICFSCGVAHGTELAQKFNEAGINAVQISYKDTDDYKADVLAEFAKPDTDIKIVISSDILTRGFDQPDVEHVILARPLKKSFSSHVQMVGRGARPYSDKEFCLVQDHAGNWLRFADSWHDLHDNGVHELSGAPDEKSRKEPTENEKKAAKCPRCGALWGKSDTCAHCGYVRPVVNKVAAVPGQMLELTKPKKSEYTSEYKKAWYQSMVGLLRSKGKNDGRAYHLYKAKFGVFPIWNKEAGQVSPDVEKYLQKANIAFAKGRASHAV